MLGILNHPKLDYTWFTTTLLRWSSEGLVVYDRWVLNLSGVGEYGHNGGTVLLDFYYLCYLIAFIGVLFFFTRYRKQGWLKVKPHVPYDALLLTMIGVLVGAKTAYIFIYNPDFYFGPPPFGPVDTNDMLQRIFLNWSGMASHGAAAGVMCMAILWWLRARPKVPIAQLGDVGGIAAAFGAIWIRLANFMNGELYGRVAPDWLPWAMRFPVRSGKGNAVVFQTDTLWERMPKPENPELVASWLKTLQESNPGGVIEQTDSVLFRNPDAYQQGWEIMLRTQDGAQFMTPQKDHIYMGVFDVVTTPRHPSQLYQLLLEGLLVLIFLLILRKRVKRAGMVAAGFWIAYPVARFIGEFFRQPDVQFQQAGNELGTVFLGLSMGQILSLLMACVGTGLMIYFARFGRVIADEPMYPPEPEKPKAEGPVSVTIEKGMGGSTGAGEIAGIETVRAALAEKEKEWAKDERPEGTLERQDDDQDKPEPGQPERGD
ncbi:MAG: prolipoprotein diacylglyceryl transferase [Planctomycetes bacterium]|nr:prolipoprotein diacylglyceryl transferase [Planctomycetota bacterium]MCB9934686.1 prolipoprotein diacylglyceryl transferase [Planctomycetota bacterium]